MDSIDIYRGVDIFTTIKPDDSATQQKKVMGENELRITFQDNHYIEFKINDYCNVFDEVYKFQELPSFRKVSKYRYEYTLIMKAEGQDLNRAQFLFLGDDNTLRESEFSLMGTADTFMDLLLANAARVGTWEKGQVIPTGYKNLTFSRENCYSALQRLAEAFGTEFAIEGRKVHLTKRAKDTGYEFKQGQHKGLYDVTRVNIDQTSIVTRLYAYGATKNLPSDYRNYSGRLKLPLLNYLERNVDKYGVIESVQFFEDIYPHRTGTVTSVNAVDPYKFIDADIDFDVNAQLLPGVVAKITFNTGQLAGYTFDIASYTSGEFTILKNKEEKSLDVPSASIRAAIGDEYVLTDIKMPQSYIDTAENLLQATAEATLATSSEPQVTYTITFDPTYLRRKKKELNIGDLVWLIDDELDITRKIRMVSIVRNIVNEYDYTVELSDVIVPNPIDELRAISRRQGRDLLGVNGTLNSNPLFNGIGVFPSIDSGRSYSPVLVDNITGRMVRGH
jgi:hypothetical protein